METWELLVKNVNNINDIWNEIQILYLVSYNILVIQEIFTE